MKVMGPIQTASCLSCGLRLMHLGWPDRATGDFSAVCGTFACERKGVAVRLTSPIIEAPLVYPEWQ